MIYLNDKHISEYGLYCRPDEEHMISPEQEHRIIEIPSRPGAWYFDSQKKPILHVIPMAALTDSMEETNKTTSDFVNMLFDPFGQPRELKLRYEYDKEKYYLVKLRGSMTPEKFIGFSDFVCEFISYDPHKFASMNQYDKGYEYDRGFDYDSDLFYDNPLSFNWIYTKHYSGINNYSSLNTELMIDIQGTVTNPKIVNLGLNQTLTLPSINNGRLVIDGKRFVIIQNGQEILEGSNYNFFNIQPGEVDFLFVGENPNATVTYKWLHKFN